MEKTNHIPVGQAAKVLRIFNLSGQTESLSYLTLRLINLRVVCLILICFLGGVRQLPDDEVPSQTARMGHVRAISDGFWHSLQ